jgi:hypothetical protein
MLLRDETHPSNHNHNSMISSNARLARSSYMLTPAENNHPSNRPEYIPSPKTIPPTPK